MFKKLFGVRDRKKEEVLFSPLSGKVLNLQEVPDPTFAQKMLGEGIAIEPFEGKVTSPVNGEIIQIFPTKHAVGILSESGLEVLIHIGIDTVSMDGEGFTARVKAGDRVKVGQPLIDFSIELVKEKAASTITPMIITNSERIEQIDFESPSAAVNGETTLMKIKVKS